MNEQRNILNKQEKEHHSATCGKATWKHAPTKMHVACESSLSLEESTQRADFQSLALKHICILQSEAQKQTRGWVPLLLEESSKAEQRHIIVYKTFENIARVNLAWFGSF